MRRFFAAGLAGLMLTACVEDARETGASLFAENCVACHGADGRGDGPMTAELAVTPPDLTGIVARNGGVFPRDYVMSMIDGYSRGQHGAQIMPEFGAGDMGDTVVVEDDQGRGIPVPSRLLLLADYLQSIQTAQSQIP